MHAFIWFRLWLSVSRCLGLLLHLLVWLLLRASNKIMDLGGQILIEQPAKNYIFALTRTRAIPKTTEPWKWKWRWRWRRMAPLAHTHKQTNKRKLSLYNFPSEKSDRNLIFHHPVDKPTAITITSLVCIWTIFKTKQNKTTREKKNHSQTH